METHMLKILPEYYQEILSGRKTYELRLNDRNYKEGDKLILKEWDNVFQIYLQSNPIEFYVGHSFCFILEDKEYCIMSLINT